MNELFEVNLIVNNKSYSRRVEPRLLLSDFLRHDLDLTGTHVGCEHGVCGACTILFDALPIRSCIMFAVQADGHELTTVEGLSTFGSEKNGELHPIQQAFWEKHGLQCGFCTAGILMTVLAYLKENPKPSEHDVRVALSGHLCRCTGYQHIVDAVLLAAEKMQVSTMDLPG